MNDLSEHQQRGIPAADLRLTVTLHTIFAWHPSKS